MTAPQHGPAGTGSAGTAPAAPPVRAVWTDFGGVLTPPVRQTGLAFCERLGVSPLVMEQALTRVAARYGCTDLMEPLDTPLVGEAEWTREVEQVLAADFSLRISIGDYADAWFKDRPVNGEWLAFLKELRADGVFVGMLSNMVPTWDAHWRRMVPPDGAFDEVVLSFEAGCRKPMPEIFRLAEKAAGLPADACVLVDDVARNCAGARAAGWQAVEFTGTAQAVAELTSLLGRSRPPGAATPAPQSTPDRPKETRTA